MICSKDKFLFRNGYNFRAREIEFNRWDTHCRPLPVKCIVY